MTWQTAPPIILQTVVTALPLGLPVQNQPAGGVGTIKYGSPLDMRLTQIAISASVGQQGRATLFINDVFVLASLNAWQDVADGDPPLFLAKGDQLKISLVGFYPGDAQVSHTTTPALVIVRIENEQDIP